MKHYFKGRIRRGVGVEFLIAATRELSSEAVAKWFRNLAEAFDFCESVGCQLVVSSGARDASDMVSGVCFDEILTEAGIDHRKYWKDLDTWLREVVSRKVISQ
jgi:hypothetical protein